MRRARTRSTPTVADRALSRLEIDALGLDAMDRRYLTMIADLYGGGPVGVETLAAGLSEPRDTIEDVIEPYLIQLGLIARTARGRCLNGRGYAHLGLPQPQGGQAGLFDPGSVIRNNASFCSVRCALHSWRASSRSSPASCRCSSRARIIRRTRPGSASPAAPTSARRRLPTTALNPNGYGVERAKPRRQGSAARLLLRLSDGLARSRA